jgi:hypothetical protein
MVADPEWVDAPENEDETIELNCGHPMASN